MYRTIGVSAISAIIREATKDDEDYNFFSEFIGELSGAAFGGFFGARDFVQMGLTFAMDEPLFGKGAPSALYAQPFERAYKTFQAINSDSADLIDVGREGTKFINSFLGVPDTMTDSFWTTLRWFDNDMEDDAVDYLRSVIFDKKLKKQ